jgi:RES domain-containing protein
MSRRSLPSAVRRRGSIDQSIPTGALRLWRLALGDSPWQTADGPGRWSLQPDAMIYSSCTAALAVLEARAHLDNGDAHRVFRLGRIDVEVEPGELRCLRCERLPPDWKRRKRLTREIGEAWLSSGASAALLVPSALCGGEMNALVNPAHPAWDRWRRRAQDHAFRFDPRLIGPGRP